MIVKSVILKQVQDDISCFSLLLKECVVKCHMYPNAGDVA